MQLFGMARNPVPSGAIVGELKGYDGAPLRFARWEPTRGPRRGTACVFPGRTEFIEKYFEVVADLRRRGFAVAILDWRGQGGSPRALKDPRKGHIRDFDEYDRDLLRFMKDIVLPDCLPPYVAVAHSMGANILLRNAALPGSWFDRMVLTAPLIALAPGQIKTPEPIARACLAGLSLAGQSTRYVPGGGPDPEEMRPFENNRLTSDPIRFARNRALIEQAPALALGSPTIGWLRAAFRAMDRIQAHDYPARIAVPLLVVAAGDDQVVSTRAIEEFSLRLKVGTHVLVKDARHEILQEREELRQHFWAAFDAYLGVPPVH